MSVFTDWQTDQRGSVFAPKRKQASGRPSTAKPEQYRRPDLKPRYAHFYSLAVPAHAIQQETR